MNCQPQARADSTAAANDLAQRAEVVQADLLEPAADPTDRWAIDALVRHRRGIPSTVSGALAAHGLTIHTLSRQGPFLQQVIATA